MRPGPSTICTKLLNTVSLNAEPCSLIEIITDMVLAEGWCSSRSEAREKAERWEKRTLSSLQQEISVLQEMGRPSRLAFNSSSEYMIQGACFIEPIDSDDLKDKKRRRSRATDYSAILGEITPRQFEFLCGQLIKMFGVENPVVTRSSSDEGIDFYGKLSLDSMFFPNDLNPTIQRQLSIWMIGQAKHYQASQSGTPEIRELVGAITLARAGVFGSLEPPFQDLQIRVADPVFALFITTGPISSYAWRLLTKSGVIGMDGEMLSAFLSDRGVGLEEGSLNRDRFVRWIEE